MHSSPRMHAYLSRLTEVAHERGTAIALVDETQQVSFQEMLELMQFRREALLSAGLRSGDRVAIVAENSADYLITVLGLWAADAVPVTIYPSTTEADLRMCLHDADVSLVLADERTNALASAAVLAEVPVGNIGPNFSVPGVSSSAQKSPDEVIDRLALISYSSGTTSRPKAIMVSSDAIANMAHRFGEAWRLSPQDTTLVALPMAWMFGLTTSSFCTLYAGGKVVSLKRSRPEMMAAAIVQHGVTVLPAVTTVLTKLANYLDAAEQAPDLSTLRLIVSGGEPRNEHSFGLLKQYAGVAVHDNYCASELAPLITYDPVADPEPRAGSAGRLVPGTQLRVIDADGNDVAPGEAGEAIGFGPGLMLGYWNDPELTKEALTEDGWYRTKDLVRVDEDGYVHVVGRLSDMIIRGGSNVSPSEVEAHIRSFPGTEDVAVIGLPDADYGEEVVAVVQMREKGSLISEDLTAHLKARLSGYKIPTRFVEVDVLPLNATTGKVNRKLVKAEFSKGN